MMISCKIQAVGRLKIQAVVQTEIKAVLSKVCSLSDCIKIQPDVRHQMIQNKKISKES